MSETYLHSFETEDGLVVRVRPEGPGDAQHLIDLFEHLGAESRYLRFSKVMRTPDPDLVYQEAERLARLGPPGDMAWLAFADLPDEPGAPVGGVRFAGLEPGVAEIAISVRDDLQRRGIGSELLTFGLEQARAAGIHQVVAVFLASNRAIWRLLRHSPFRTAIDLHGSEVRVTVDLDSDRATAGRE